MCIFYLKALSCGCEIIACHFRKDNNSIILSNHSYKWICNKCINLPSEVLDNKLNNMKNNINFNKIYCKDDYIFYSNGWYRSPSSPTEYFIPNEHRVFGIDYI